MRRAGSGVQDVQVAGTDYQEERVEGGKCLVFERTDLAAYASEERAPGAEFNAESVFVRLRAWRGL